MSVIKQFITINPTAIGDTTATACDSLVIGMEQHTAVQEHLVTHYKRLMVVIV